MKIRHKLSVNYHQILSNMPLISSADFKGLEQNYSKCNEIRKAVN